MRRRPSLRRAITGVLVAALGIALVPDAPALAAGPSRKWSKVLALGAETHVFVTRDDGSTVEGWVVAVHDSRMILDAARRAGEYVEIERGRVSQVAVLETHRPWYAVPAVIGAVVAGLAASVGVLWAMTECDNGLSGSNCDDGSDNWFILVIGAPVAAGAWAYHALGPRQSWRVIYEVVR